MNGQVFLIGAGPGDPRLITVKGLAYLREADVVVYDRLVAPALLREARADAELINVGKVPEHHPVPQEEINALLVAKARAGKRVARLKGGDPFVLGRGGEEADALARAGVAFEVVPGVTSAIAVPAYAGIPVTQRGVAAGFRVVTGHRNSEFGIQNSKFKIQNRKSKIGETLIVLMGVENLSTIVGDLLEGSWARETPAALIADGTTPRQRTVVGTLGDIAVKGEGVSAPAVLVVGEVVQLRERLQWFENRPLFGRRVVVTRAQEQAADLTQQLEALGAEVVEFPTIAIAPLEDCSALDAALERVAADEYAWLGFTSANGVEAVWARLNALGRDARAFAGARLAAIGPATSAGLARRGLVADFVPRVFRSEVVATTLPIVPGDRVLLPRANLASETLPEGLRARGAQVDEVIAYRVVPANTPPVELTAGDIITFTSGSTVEHFIAQVGADALRDCRVVCIGPATAEAARRLGIRVDAAAEEHTGAGLVKAVVECGQVASHRSQAATRDLRPETFWE
jgi:uroporphyrinogen III methyltransferase/synthase